MKKKKKNRHGETRKKPAAAQGSNGSRAVSTDVQKSLSRGLSQHRAGDLLAAENHYKNVLQADPENSEAWHLSGLVAFQQKRFKEAADCIKHCLDNAPGNATAHYNMARTLKELGKAQQAIDHYRQAVSLNPGYVSAWFNLGNILAEGKKLDEAVDAYSNAAETAPQDTQILNNWGNVLCELNLHKEAAEVYKRAIDIDPSNAMAITNLGNAFRSMHSMNEAVKVYRRALDAQPDNPTILLALARALEGQDDLADAEQNARRSVEIAPSEDAWFRLGHILHEKGDTGEALHCYQKVLTFNPGNAVVFNNMGLLAKDAEENEEAEKLLRKAVELDPAYGPAWTNLAIVLERTDRLEEAEKAARKGAELEPAATAFLRVGSVLDSLNRREEAIELYRRCLELDPEDKHGAGLELARLGVLATPAKASDAYVRRLFDLYAANFDAHLQQKLEYRGPDILLEALRPWLEREAARGRELSVLDLGCGTGLCGEVLRPYARILEGVDLSPRMVAKARERKIYDKLEVEELSSYLRRSGQPFDLLAAGDVLVYIGDLAELFESAAGALRPGGVFAFTVEKHDGEGFLLTGTSRYAHSLSYLSGLAGKYGFREAVLKETSTRREADKAVPCLVGVFELTGSSTET